MKIHIIGAGMAGLLAANILRRHDISVFEKQPYLPNNHHAVLRFRTPNVGDALGIQFKKVNMIKTYVPYSNIVADSLSYSMKCTGEYRSDRSIMEGTVVSERYVAPPDLIEQMGKGIEALYNVDYNFNDSKLPAISTIPMPTLMKILNYLNRIEFKNIYGIVMTATIENCDSYVSLLFPGPQSYSRATITGNQLIIEFPDRTEIPNTEHLLEEITPHLGLYMDDVRDIKFKKQEYFKILNINDAERKKFMRWASVNHNVYSLGRYATWRPKLLLDDLIQDLRKIEEWICK